MMANGRDLAHFSAWMCFLCNKFAVPYGLVRHQRSVSSWSCAKYDNFFARLVRPLCVLRAKLIAVKLLLFR
jgi:hypothetical protein